MIQDTLYHLALADEAHFACVEGAVSVDELRGRLEGIAETVEDWNGQQEGILFVSPASLETLRARRDDIVAFPGTTYVAPHDADAKAVQELFDGTDVTVLYANTPDEFRGDHVGRLVDTVICEDARVKFPTERETYTGLWERAWELYLPSFQEYGGLVATHLNNKSTDGSISMPWGDAMVITATKTDKSRLTSSDLTVVTDLDPVLYQGVQRPSSETLLHVAIAHAFPNTGAIIHSHCRTITYHSGFEHLRTPEFIPYGTPALGAAAVTALQRSGQQVAILRNHGEVAFGKNFQEAYDALIGLKAELP